jgi:di/tricarboxylate transporter
MFQKRMKNKKKIYEKMKKNKKKREFFFDFFFWKYFDNPTIFLQDSNNRSLYLLSIEPARFLFFFFRNNIPAKGMGMFQYMRSLLRPSCRPDLTKENIRHLVSSEKKLLISSLVFGIVFLFLAIFWSPDPKVTWEGWYVIAVILSTIVACIRIVDQTKWHHSFLFAVAVTALLVPGVLSPRDVLDSFATESVLSIANLLILSSALDKTRILNRPISKILGSRYPKYFWIVRLKIISIVAISSAFINNTPIVSLAISILEAWSVQHNVPLPRILIPLSYGAMLGGTNSLVGTSTNLVVADLYNNLTDGEDDLSLFSVARVGLPMTIFGVLYLVFSPDILVSEKQDYRRYIGRIRTCYRVRQNSTISGRIVKDTDLGCMRGIILYSMCSDQNEDEEENVSSPKERILHGGDILRYAGVETAIRRLDKNPNLEPYRDDSPCTIFELFISNIDCTLEDFRQKYGVDIVTINRSGKTMRDLKPETKVQSKDVLLISADTIPNAFMYDRAFSKLRALPDHGEYSLCKERTRGVVCLVLMGLNLLLSGLRVLPLSVISTVSTVIVVLMRIVTWEEALQAASGSLLLLIGLSISLGHAFRSSGLSMSISNSLSLVLESISTFPFLLVVFLATVLSTSVLSNVGAVSLIVPILAPIVERLELPLDIVLYTVMVAASSSFIFPIGYQTNSMVQQAGNYETIEFVKLGLPLVGIATIFVPGVAFIWTLTT